MPIPESAEFGSASFYGTEPTLDEVIKRYKIHPASSDFYLKTKKVFLEKIRETAQDNDCILDLGCSFGFVTCGIAKIYLSMGLDVKIFGIDIDSRQIKNATEFAKREGLTQIQFSVCDARDISNLYNFLENECKPKIKVNKIVSLYSFHHIPDFPVNKIKGMKNEFKINVLKKIFFHSYPQTLLIIGDIVIPRNFKKIGQWTEPRLVAAQKASEEARRMEENAIKGVKERTNEYPISLKEFENMIQKAGWKIISKEIIVPYNDIVIVAQQNRKEEGNGYLCILD